MTKSSDIGNEEKIRLIGLCEAGIKKANLRIEINGIREEIRFTEDKIFNLTVYDSAPPEAVDKEKLKIAEAKEKLVRAKEALAKI